MTDGFSSRVREWTVLGVAGWICLFAWIEARSASASPLPTRADSEAASVDSWLARLGDRGREVRLKAQRSLEGELAGPGRDRVRSSLVMALASPNYRVRAGAAAVLSGCIDGDESILRRLAEALVVEASKEAREALASALVEVGPHGLTLTRSMVENPNVGDSAARKRAWTAYVDQAVIRSLVDLVRRVTSFSGGVKGFYADPVRELKPIYGDAVLSFTRIVENPSYSLLMRAFAIRSIAEIGDLGGPSVVPRLLAVFERTHRLCLQRRYSDWPWRILGNIDQERKDVIDFHRYLSQSLLRLGEERPFQERMARLLYSEREKSKDIEAVLLDLEVYRRAWRRRLDEEERVVLESMVDDRESRLAGWLMRDLIPLRWFIAYDYQQVRDDDRAIEFYKKSIEAGAILKEFVERLVPEVYLSYYNMACIEARRNRADPALHYLARAFVEGFEDIDWVKEDRDLDPIRDDERFGELIREYE